MSRKLERIELQILRVTLWNFKSPDKADTVQATNETENLKIQSWVSMNGKQTRGDLGLEWERRCERQKGKSIVKEQKTRWDDEVVVQTLNLKPRTLFASFGEVEKEVVVQSSAVCDFLSSPLYFPSNIISLELGLVCLSILYK